MKSKRDNHVSGVYASLNPVGGVFRLPLAMETTIRSRKTNHTALMLLAWTAQGA